MGFLSLIFGKSYEEHERSGDTFFSDGVWGQAKIEYETALYKLEKKTPDKMDDIQRLGAKFGRAREALSLSHRHEGEEMLESGCIEDARDLFSLALELTEDPALENELKDLIKRADDGILLEGEEEISHNMPHGENVEIPSEIAEESEYFMVLCSTLPPHIRKAYMGYGSVFKDGYVALNNGEFEQAAVLLSKAMDECSDPKSYIPLELATAYLNLGKTTEAAGLLEELLIHHPDSLPAYQALCEIYWEKGEYARAEKLLESCPEDLIVSVEATLLRGETLYREGRYTEAKAFYAQIMENFGWNESIARELAKVHVALGEKESARHIYATILKECSACRTRPDPFIKRKYADLSFELGEYTSEVLELYLFLAQEDPDNRSDYFIKASRIFRNMGNLEEARRFKLLSEEHEKG